MIFWFASLTVFSLQNITISRTLSKCSSVQAPGDIFFPSDEVPLTCHPYILQFRLKFKRKSFSTSGSDIKMWYQNTFITGPLWLPSLPALKFAMLGGTSAKSTSTCAFGSADFHRSSNSEKPSSSCLRPAHEGDLTTELILGMSNCLLFLAEMNYPTTTWSPILWVGTYRL